MKMLLDKNRLITERQKRAWSQTQLAEVSGLSLRTIQRIEKNGKASLESAKALASVFSLKITDLRIINPEEVSLTAACQPNREVFCFLTLSAKTLTATVFILSSLVLLFMLWTNIPPAWINDLRDEVFSEQLSVSTLNMISTCLAVISTLSISILIGLLYDALRGQGFYHYMKYSIQAAEFSLLAYYVKTQQTMIKYVKFVAKPLIISSIILLISAAGIYMTMEDYQKKNMARFLQTFISAQKAEIS